MDAWIANTAALFVATLVIGILALALLWRIGSWRIPPAASLILDEGLPLGASAPQIAAFRGNAAYHLSFGGTTTLLVFGTHFCEPCKDLVAAASRHPATRRVRKVYVGDS